MESRRRQPARSRKVRAEAAYAEVAAGRSRGDASSLSPFAARELPVLPLRGTVLLPNMVVPLYIDRAPAVRSVEAAMAADQALLVVAQRADQTDNPTADDLFAVGTECIVTRMLRMPDGCTSVLVQGVRRARIERWLQFEPHGLVRACAFDDPESVGPQVEALMRGALDYLEACSKLSERLQASARRLPPPPA